MIFFRCPSVAIFLIMIAGLSVQSCKKEYVDRYNPVHGDTVTVSGYNYMQSFKLREFSTDTVLTATITNDSIIIIWPSYKPLPDSIKPEILLPEKATVSPASGVKVPFKTGTAFMVTSQAGVSKKYSLGIDFRQPTPIFTTNIVYLEVGNIFNLAGEYFLPDTSRTKIILVSLADQREYPAEVLSATINKIQFIVPQELPLNVSYGVRLINGIHTVYVFRANRMKAADFGTTYVFDIGSPFTVKRGETFVIRGANLTGVKGAGMASLSNSTVFPLEVLEIIGKDKIKLKVPATTPVGTYDRGVDVYLTAQGANGAYQRGAVIVNVTD